MTTREKNELLDALSVSYNRANYLKILCEETGKPDEAMQFGRRLSRLRLEIDGLLRDLYQDWVGNASALGASLVDSRKALDACLVKIEASTKTAESITKALGYIDKVIELATALTP